MSESKYNFVEVDGARWLGLPWVKIDHVTEKQEGKLDTVRAVRSLHPGVQAVFDKADGANNVMALVRTDMDTSKPAMVILADPSLLQKTPFGLQGNKKAKGNTTGRDTALSLTLELDDPAYIAKMDELMWAYVVAAKDTRDQWAPAKWRLDEEKYGDVAVERYVRAHFGYTPPQLEKEKKKAADDALLKRYIDEEKFPFPRVKTADEYHGYMTMKIKARSVIPPVPPADDAELNTDPKSACVFDMQKLFDTGKEVPMTRAQAVKWSTVNAHVCMFGIPLGGDKGFNRWRVMKAFVHPPIERDHTITEDGIAAMRAGALKRGLEAPEEPEAKHARADAPDDEELAMAAQAEAEYVAQQEALAK